MRLRKRKYRLLAQPLEFFERIWTGFAAGDGCVTLLARAGGRAIAGRAVRGVGGTRLYYKFGASAGELLPLRPNDAIYWAAIRQAAERGLRTCSTGACATATSPAWSSFKRKWASIERSLVTLRSGEVAATPAQRALGAELGELTRLLTDDAVPDETTERAGAVLYHYFC